MTPKQKDVSQRVEDGLHTVFEGAQMSAEADGLSFSEAQAAMMSGAVVGMINQIMALSLTIGDETPDQLAAIFGRHVIDGVKVFMAGDHYKSAAKLVREFKGGDLGSLSELASKLEGLGND